MAPKHNYQVALQPDPEQVTFLEKVVGGTCYISFIVIWLSSVASPFLFVLSVLHDRYIAATCIALLTAISYLPWNKGHLSNSLRYIFSHYSPLYFKSSQILFEGEKLPTRTDPQTFYAIHPHGAFCIGWSLLFVHEALEHVRFCFAPTLYASPFFRLFSRAVGKPGSAAKDSMVSYMIKGESLALPPGGFEEATLSYTQKDRVFIKKRTGFVRLCLQHGIALRPVYVFGEKSLYWNIQGMFPFRLALNRYGFPAILAWGHPLLPLLPRQSVDVKICVGAPIILPKIEQPSKEDVKRWHDKYVAALVKLFEDHKEDAYGTEQGKLAKLEVW